MIGIGPTRAFPTDLSRGTGFSTGAAVGIIGTEHDAGSGCLVGAPFALFLMWRAGDARRVDA